MAHNIQWKYHKRANPFTYRKRYMGDQEGMSMMKI